MDGINNNLKLSINALIIGDISERNIKLVNTKLSTNLPETDVKVITTSDLREATIQLINNNLIKIIIIDLSAIKYTGQSSVDYDLLPYINSFIKKAIDINKHGSAMYKFIDLINMLRSDCFIKSITSLSEIEIDKLSDSYISCLNDKQYTPLLSELKDISNILKHPFHTLPIFKGMSINQSYWMNKASAFYSNFLSTEISVNTDNIINKLNNSEVFAAESFGATNTKFISNGTTVSNKIILQALLRPGDIALVGQGCHKSIHYGLALTGAGVVYINGTKIIDDMENVVTIKSIRNTLLYLKNKNMLDKVKILILTNCTFDGVIYDPQLIMEECLSIKPDLIFLWDEAWFSFAAFHPFYKLKSAMFSAKRLYDKFKSNDYISKYKKCLVASKSNILMVDPSNVSIRVYATQSPHKSISALRQASLIHIRDEMFDSEVKHAFEEAMHVYTTTSPNFNILASLDIARSQMDLEGYDLIDNKIDLALCFRKEFRNSDILSIYFDLIEPEEIIPNSLYEIEDDIYTSKKRINWDSWINNEFAVDPLKITLKIKDRDINVIDFKNNTLLSKYGIQINKVDDSRILFVIHIGLNDKSINHLINSLEDWAREYLRLRNSVDTINKGELVNNCSIENVVPKFHSYFSYCSLDNSAILNLRKAYLLSLCNKNCFYISNDEFYNRIKDRDLISASFIYPYPPGTPILVPGQIVTEKIHSIIQKTKSVRMDGYDKLKGIRVFKEEILEL